MILLFGVASKGKGPDLLLRALKQVPPTFLVYLVGRTGGVYDPVWGDLRELQGTGWEGRVHMVGRHVSDDEMHNYYAACDAVVIPYRYGTTGTVTHLRRAIEYGKAVIGCDQFHIGERVREHGLGLVFKTEDVESLAASLREFAGKDQPWFDQCRDNGRPLVRDESWEAVGRMYRELFERMLARRSKS